MENIKKMKIYLFILMFGLYGLLGCNGQNDEIDNYHEYYSVGQIPDLNDFYIYNENELRMDSVMSMYNTIANKGTFRQNRSRIFMDSYRNSDIQKMDTAFYNGFSMPCNCYTANDTTYIKMGLGFFGGFGFTLKIYKDKFESGFFDYTDDVKPFKTNLNDSVYYSYIQVENKYQMLMLDDKPTQKIGQQLTGLLNFTTENYYEKNQSHSLDTIYLKGKIFFTCQITDKVK